MARPTSPMPAQVLDLLAGLPDPTGEALRAARLAAGLTLAQAAQLMGYSTAQAVAKAESGNGCEPARFAVLLLATGQHPGLTVTAKP